MPLQANPNSTHATLRLSAIAQARQAMLMDLGGPAHGGVAPWVERSWQRCLGYGLQANTPATFAVLSKQHMHRTADHNAHLVRTAKPLLENLGRAIVNTRYFAILTNSEGVVVDASGAIDHTDPRADLITRVGTDLSERAMGTTAISTALAELQPVWLHRGEHFFANTTHYSCAGAPVTGPDGRCAGMLDLTGIDSIERPELKHLVTQTASKIENALLLNQPHALTLRLNWPGNALGSDADGLVCLDADGWITGANPTARQMCPTCPWRGLHRCTPAKCWGCPLKCCLMPPNAVTPCWKFHCGQACGYRHWQVWHRKTMFVASTVPMPLLRAAPTSRTLRPP